MFRYESFYKEYNTMADEPIKLQVRQLLKGKTFGQCVSILGDLYEEYRRKSSTNANAKQMGRIIDERPDEILMKPELSEEK